MWIVILINVLLFCVYYYIIKPLKYWKDKNVQHDNPLPIFGNILPLVLRKCASAELFQKIYKKFPNGRYIGMYNFTTPGLILTDPELIKRIMVKEFETFPERREIIPPVVDPLWAKSILAVKDREEWHELRATLSPFFTSSKMKAMFELIKECSKQFSAYYIQKEGVNEINAKEVFARFANDVIATCAFGVTCNSHSDPNNEFYLLGKQATNVTGIVRIAVLLNFFSSNLAKLLKISIFSEKMRNFFTTLVSETLRVREEKKIVRYDMLHLLMESRKGRLKYEEGSVPEAGFAVVKESQFGKINKRLKLEITDEVITAQVLAFFFAGFETISTMLGYTIYELAVNPDIQDKLRHEIDITTKLADGGEFTYKNLMSMKYLDMVISEALRKWPPAHMVSRRSICSFTIEAELPDEAQLHLEKQSIIFCPIFSIHRDEKYYPNPEKFDPERFNEANGNKIHPYTYLPFGVGPRNCIGSRFALLEGKLLIAEIVKNFEIVPISRTQIPMELSKINFLTFPDDGVWLGLKRRSLA